MLAAGHIIVSDFRAKRNHAAVCAGRQFIASSNQGVVPHVYCAVSSSLMGGAGVLGEGFQRPVAYSYVTTHDIDISCAI